MIYHRKGNRRNDGNGNGKSNAGRNGNELTPDDIPPGFTVPRNIINGNAGRNVNGNNGNAGRNVGNANSNVRRNANKGNGKSNAGRNGNGRRNAGRNGIGPIGIDSRLMANIINGRRNANKGNGKSNAGRNGIGNNGNDLKLSLIPLDSLEAPTGALSQLVRKALTNDEVKRRVNLQGGLSAVQKYGNLVTAYAPKVGNVVNFHQLTNQAANQDKPERYDIRVHVIVHGGLKPLKPNNEPPVSVVDLLTFSAPEGLVVVDSRWTSVQQVVEAMEEYRDMALTFDSRGHCD